MTVQQLLKKKSSFYKIGETPVVILPLEDYEKIKEELEMLSSKKLAKQITKAREEIRQGKTYSLEEAKKKLKLNR